MLKTAFIGNRNFFDEFVCRWLSEHTDLSLIVWTNTLSWSHGGPDRRARVLRRFLHRRRRHGLARTLDEALYYLLYRRFLTRRETAKLQALVAAESCSPRRPLSEIPQLQPTDIRSPELRRTIESLELDAMFAMCIDVFLPAALIDAPKHGSFLWHEGITPEYRGVYSPFWALVNQDYSRLGYTLLKMNGKLDAGDIYVQGPVRCVDLERDWHSYIGHKAILDSLPATREFLDALERGAHRPIVRERARDGYYSYPTATGLLKIAAQRLF